MNKLRVKLLDLGRISFADAWEIQTTLHDKLKAIKLKNQREGLNIPKENVLIVCEHHPVYTLGKSGSVKHLLLDETELKNKGIDYFKINRGGDITYHGPGQLVVYPIFDLDDVFTDVHKYVRYLEEAVIRVLANFEIKGERIDGYTGVWIKGDERHEQDRKICAIGVHLSRWVTMHGLAFNVNTDLSYFNHIVPCGISDEDKAVCSMESELGGQLDFNKIKAMLIEAFENLFNIEWE